MWNDTLRPVTATTNTCLCSALFLFPRRFPLYDLLFLEETTHSYARQPLVDGTRAHHTPLARKAKSALSLSSTARTPSKEPRRRLYTHEYREKECLKSGESWSLSEMVLVERSVAPSSPACLLRCPPSPSWPTPRCEPLLRRFHPNVVLSWAQRPLPLPWARVAGARPAGRL